jgi:hypothetical protein
MAVDIPENVAANVLASQTLGFNLAIEELRNNSANAANIVRHSAVRRFDELGIGESRAQTGMLATDIGGPTNPAGA